MAATFLDLASSADVPIRAPTPDAGNRSLDDLLQAAADQPELSEFLQVESPGRQLLLAALALSPYLSDIAMRRPDCVWRALTSEPQGLLTEIIGDTRDAWHDTVGREPEFMQRLRRHKSDVAFSLALYDLARLFPTRRITEWLSAFAEAALSAAVDHLLLNAHDAGKITLPDIGSPSIGSGLAILGMGKLGASELNYSSDIDLVAVYDPGRNIVADRDATGDVFARIVKRLVHVMQERTRDGYVFRTDLRLRPDPGSTPLAISTEAALLYYEGRGQNWERAAFIKARALAGDLDTGNAFRRELTPFIFRKYLDYGTIADIHSIKRQIHAHKGFGDIAVRGHNIKLGRGGIREIEFFVQTQQLIAGGRMPELRAPATEDALAKLAEAKWINSKTEEEMLQAYWYLRDLEHRIQMRRDEQTHVLPEDDAALEQIALMMGYAHIDDLSQELAAVLKRVEQHYAALFENEAGLTSGAGNLVFTGDDDDPGTLETLGGLGFERPSDVSRIIRTWHYGRYRATQTETARKQLTALMPQLLQAFADTKRADEALLRFDAFLSGLPSGIQLFSLLGNNPGLLTLIVNVMASAPRLADVISRRPHVFDGMLDPTLLAELPTRAYLGKRLDEFLDGDFLYEEILDRLRIFASEQRFLIGMRLMTSSISGDRAARAFSDLAALIIGVATQAVERELAKAHGRLAGGKVAILGMGKLGSREMTAESDIDIILLYSHDEDCLESDGPKPIDAPRYYARFTQRLVAALSAPTAEGVLYEVDLRLRPSGNKGPVATHIRAFEKYQAEGAWTWEHMALTRARVVSGDDELSRQAMDIVNSVLDRKRDRKKIAVDIADMRQRIETEKPPASVWDLKLLSGGIIDIEFIAQFLRLMATTNGVNAEDVGTRTSDVLRKLAPSQLGDGETKTLLEALALYQEISQITRLCLSETFDPPQAPAAFRELLLNICDFPDIDRLQLHVSDTSNAVRDIFTRTIGAPQAQDGSVQ